MEGTVLESQWGNLGSLPEEWGLLLHLAWVQLTDRHSGSSRRLRAAYKIAATRSYQTDNGQEL